MPNVAQEFEELLGRRLDGITAVLVSNAPLDTGALQRSINRNGDEIEMLSYGLELNAGTRTDKHRNWIRDAIQPQLD